MTERVSFVKALDIGTRVPDCRPNNPKGAPVAKFSLAIPGFFYDVDIDDYARDPCPSPSLDSRTAKAMRDLTPMHARWLHTKLNPDPENLRAYARVMDIGGAFHARVLEQKDITEKLPYEDYKLKDAQLARRICYENGKVPLVFDDADTLENMVLAFYDQGGAEVLGMGTPELSGFFALAGAWCRTRPDWTDTSHEVVKLTALKTVSTYISADDMQRKIFREGWDLQAALHIHGCRKLFAREAVVTWLVQEQKPPYALSTWHFGGASQELAVRYVEQVADRWARCLDENNFPGPSQLGKSQVGYRRFDADFYRISLGLGEE